LARCSAAGFTTFFQAQPPCAITAPGLPDLIGQYLGRIPRHLATFFILLLMVLVGTVFVKGPAKLITQLVTPQMAGGLFGTGAVDWLASPLGGQPIWLWIVMAVIFAYYLIATVLPVDKIIGRIYPLFAAALLVMVAGLAYSMIFGGLEAPKMTLSNLHPKDIAAWPIIFVTVSCGAVSGFHATQGPMMARCLRTERHMRPVFYGAMIAEGFIALIWSSAAQSYFGGVGGLAKALGPGLNNTAVVVHTVCVGTMGAVGGMLAILGVVVLPITSGDTAFRVGRLILADYLKLPQSKVKNRYLIALPLFTIAFTLNFVPFGLIWRYFGWANQTLAAVALWTGAMFVASREASAKPKEIYFWLAALPATFMTVMTATFLLGQPTSKGGFGLSPTLATAIATVLGLMALGAAWLKRRKMAGELLA
jgi:carbon starvation protein CstA